MNGHLTDKHYLQLTLDYAKNRQGFCAPNPAVGALVVKNEEIISSGYHQGCGQAHAEVNALVHFAEGELADATVYISLEPCCHQGRTPPCTDLLIRHRPKRIVFAYYDPNPEVAGKGQALLEAAGIRCEYLEIPAISLFYRAYAHWQRTQRPWVIVKLALSQDEKIAGEKGEPVALTQRSLQRFTHQQRQNADALLTTARTIQADDPHLNVRCSDNYAKPLYILDSYLNTPSSAKIFNTCSEVIIFHQANVEAERRASLIQRGAQCRIIGHDTEGLNLKAVLASIGQDGRHQLWVEAGGRCAQALLMQQLVHTLYLYQSSKTLGENAVAAFHSGLNQALLMERATCYQQHKIGDEIAYQLEFEVP